MAQPEKKLTTGDKRLKELEFLYEISISMHTLNLNELLHLILDAVTRGIRFDRARLYIFDEKQNLLRLKMSVGLEKEEPVDVTLPLDREKSIVARSFLDREPYVIQDARRDPRVNPDIVRLFNIKSFAAVPLRARDRVKGVVTADNLLTNRLISPDKLRSLVTFANHVGLAIENAEMYDRLKDFNRELEKEIAVKTKTLLKAQDELIRRERLAALGELSAGIAHEIRNPLTSIKILINSLVSELPERLRKSEDVAVINGEIERLNSIITQFLEYARPAEPVFEQVNVKEVISQTISLVSARVKARKVEMSLHLPDHDVAVHGDPRQLKQVFLNIILNAVQSMDGGGTLTVELRHSPGGGKNLDTASIIMKDTGAGIAPENLKKLFTPFFSTKKDGVGLGLSIAQSIVLKHNGTIGVESEPGKGTAFTIQLPVRA